MYKKQLFITTLRIGFLLLIYSFCRVIFLVFNWNIFSVASVSSLAESFVLGMRFDISSILLLNSLFLFLSLLPLSVFYKRGYQDILKFLFLIVNIPWIFINLADASYFSFKGKRTTFEIFGIAGDVLDQSSQLAFHYWYIIALTLIFLVLMIWKYPKSSEATGSLYTFHKWPSWLAFLLLVGVIVIGIRGGLQLKPIRPNMAFVQKPNLLGNLVLNTPLVILHTSQLPAVKRLDYFADENKCLQTMSVPYGKQASYKPVFTSQPNIVLIILESFSSEYTGFGNPWKGYTPFLDSISSQGLFFKNHLANGRTSIEGLPAIVASIPSLMTETFITSTYQSNRIVGIADVLRQQGYETSFYHAGNNGTMGFDMFAKNAGFTHYYGRNEYTGDAEHYDGTWGIFDHHYWQYFSGKLGQTKAPFMSCIFTLSSHQPYAIPKELESRFTEGPIPIIRAIKYADYALQQFFQTASKQTWFDNTLFIITADHTQEKILPWSLYNDFHIPLLFYAPKFIKPHLVEDKITQHLDIAPSIIDMLQIRHAYSNCFGHSVFDSTYAGRAMLYDHPSETAFLINKKLVTYLRPNGIIEFSESEFSKGFDLNSAEGHAAKVQYTQELKAIVQYHNNGLIDNSWFK